MTAFYPTNVRTSHADNMDHEVWIVLTRKQHNNKDLQSPSIVVLFIENVRVAAYYAQNVMEAKSVSLR